MPECIRHLRAAHRRDADMRSASLARSAVEKLNCLGPALDPGGAESTSGGGLPILSHPCGSAIASGA